MLSFKKVKFLDKRNVESCYSSTKALQLYFAKLQFPEVALQRTLLEVISLHKLTCWVVFLPPDALLGMKCF